MSIPVFSLPKDQPFDLARTDARYSFTTQDSNDTLTFFPDHVICSVRGDSVGSSNYARLKRKGSSGSKYPFAIGTGEDFAVTWQSEFSANFYSAKKTGFRVFGLWNPVQDWRLGLWIDSDNYPRLQIEKNGSLEKPPLWQGAVRLPLDRRTYRLRVLLSATSGIVELWQDNALIGGFYGRTVPTGMLSPVCNELTFGIDGAAGISSTADLKMTIYQMACAAYVDPCVELRSRLAEVETYIASAQAERARILAQMQSNNC